MAFSKRQRRARCCSPWRRSMPSFGTMASCGHQPSTVVGLVYMKATGTGQASVQIMSRSSAWTSLSLATSPARPAGSALNWGRVTGAVMIHVPTMTSWSSSPTTCCFGYWFMCCYIVFIFMSGIIYVHVMATHVHHLHAWPILLRLPPIKDKLRFATIAGSHSNQVMRMWFYGMEHASEKLTTGGRLSSEILQRSDSLYWQAVHQGVEWEIISSLVPATWKHFASLASSAANSAQQVSQGETDLQVCKKIASTWQACNAGNVMTYQEMKPILLRSKPPRTETIPRLFSFMMKCGGGATGHLMQATESFVRCNGISSRRLPVQAWDYLATDVKNKQGEQAVLWRHAMLKTMYCVENGLTPGDIKKSFSNGSIFQQVLVFERTHRELRKLGASMSELTGHMLAQGLGVFEVDSVMAILGKKFKGPHEPFSDFKDLCHAAHKCVTCWNEHVKQPVTSPWAANVAASTSSASASQTSRPSSAKGRTINASWCLIHAWSISNLRKHVKGVKVL